MAADYGTLAGVGAMVPKFAGSDGAFTGSTRPTPATVTAWLTALSGMVNTVLATNGFATPIATPTDVFNSITLFIEETVAALVNGVNGSGRFGPNSKQLEHKSLYTVLRADVAAFIEANAHGFERLGASRAEAEADAILFRDTDESGDDIAPIFQREAFGNVFDDWDN